MIRAGRVIRGNEPVETGVISHYTSTETASHPQLYAGRPENCIEGDFGQDVTQCEGEEKAVLA